MARQNQWLELLRNRYTRIAIALLVFLTAALASDPLIWDPLRARYYASQLSTLDVEKSQEIMIRLHEIGPAGNRAVIDLMDDPQPWIRRQAIEYLYRYQTDKSEELLFTALHDDAQIVWTKAEGALYGLWGKSDIERANRFYLSGISCQLRGLWENSIPFFETAFRLDPNFAECKRQIGHSYEEAGRTEEAIRAYLDTIQLKPNHFSALARLNRLYASQGKTEKAAFYASQAEALFPHWTRI